MTQAHDISSILDGLDDMEFAKITPFNGGHVGAFWSSAPESPGEGESSPWEMHPDTDELLMCFEGTIEVQILSTEPTGDFDADLTRVPLTAGQFTVVPTGHWHRHHSTSAFREFYLTPGSSEHSFDADPRLAAS